MANVLSLAMKITADANSVPKSLTPVERAFKQLDSQAAKVASVFDTFAKSSTAAAATQTRFATDLAFLQSALRTGQINAQKFAEEFAKIEDSAKKTNAAFAEGARITEESRTAEEKRAAQLERLAELLELGAIGQETYNRQVAEVSGANAAAAEAEAQLAADRQRAAEIVAASLSQEEQAQRAFQQSTEELQRLREAGLLTEQQYAAALDKTAQQYAKATTEASKLGQATDDAGKNGTLKFNELSGVLSALPGPLGSVAGRISGLSSASEGLTRVFGQGLTPGLQSLATQFSGFLTPTNLALVGVAAFGATATAVANGLSQLSGRVEELSFAARQAGVDFQTIQVLDEAASRAGVSVDALAAGVQKFGVSLTEAARGSGDTFAALQQLGFSLEEIQQAQNDPTAFAGRVAEALEGIPEPAKRAQLQIDVLGKSGETLVRAFGEIPASTQAIRRFGGAISELDKDRLLQLDTAFEDVQRSILGFGRELLTPFIGAAQSVADSLAPAIGSLGNVFGNILDIVSPLISALGLLVNAIGQASSVILNVIGAALEPFAFAFSNLSQGVDEVSRAITAGFTVINDVVLSVRDFFGFANEQTARVVEQTKQITEEEKKAADDREKTFQRLREEVNNAIDDSRKFGAEGQAAAQKYDQSIEALKQRLSSGLIDKEQFRRSVRIAGQVFDEELKAIEDRKELEIKVKEDAVKAIEKVADEIDKAAIKAEGLGRAGQQALGGFSQRADVLRRQFAVGLLDDKQLEKGIAAANREYDKQIEKIKEANQERQRAAEEDRKRSEAILDEMDKTRAVQRDMDTVQREINRLRTESGGFIYLTPEQRQQLRDLQQAQVELGEKQRAVAQGFEQGFGEAFDKTRDKFTQLSEKAAEFGDDGARAAQRLAEGLNAAAEQARRGGSAEVYEQEVRRQQQIYENELKNLKAVADERKKTNELVENELLLISVGGDSKRAEAKKNLLAIEEEMLRVQKEQQAARAANDSKALNDATKRLADLDQVAAKERDIASGAAGQREKVQKQQEDFLKEQEKQQQQIIQQQQKAEGERAKAQQAEYERQVQRITDLNTLGSRTVQTADVRTQEGAALVLNLAANAQDPALIESRLQSKYLKQINENIQTQARRPLAELIGIVGGGFVN